MANNQKATQEKRRRERKKLEVREAKAHNRALKKEQKKLRQDQLDSDVDPDLIGIFPGPQPGQVME